VYVYVCGVQNKFLRCLGPMSDTMRTLAAGAMSGVVADLTTHPLCTVKARLMVQGAAEGSGGVVYKGFFDGFTTILRTEGIGALYSGIGAVCVGAAPAQALFFAGFEATKSVLGDTETGNFAAGLMAQLTGSLAWVPMEVIKEKLMIEGQMQTKQTYGSSLTLVRKVVAEEGILGIYRGFVMQQVTCECIASKTPMRKMQARPASRLPSRHQLPAPRARGVRSHKPHNCCVVISQMGRSTASHSGFTRSSRTASPPWMRLQAASSTSPWPAMRPQPL
jgi:hypothetical protein